jgi:hypothetical protein
MNSFFGGLFFGQGFFAAITNAALQTLIKIRSFTTTRRI